MHISYIYNKCVPVVLVTDGAPYPEDASLLNECGHRRM